MNSYEEAKMQIECAKITNKESLKLRKLKIIQLPHEVWELTHLQSLELESLGLESLPDDIGRLTQLANFTAYNNKLNNFPCGFRKLTELRKLGLSVNQFTVFPEEILSLIRLKELRLTGNKLDKLPSGIDALQELEDFRVKSNKLQTLPPEIGKLAALVKLNLRRNRITSLPKEIGELQKLESIDLRNNPIVELPVELGLCGNLKQLMLSDSANFHFPPSDVIELETDAILRYLRAAGQGEDVVWESKLLLVGEGAVGKTWLYEALNNRPAGGNRTNDGATVGIEIGSLDLAHPENHNVVMRLNCWDFAGQDINHATHQFFFSERTLFVLCWNARAGWEAGKLRKWLTNIRDRAPGARVLLVATHSDQPHSDYPEKELCNEFLQIVGTFKVSNQTGEGIGDLKQAIVQYSINLPMMGLRWPKTWRAAQQAVQVLRARAPHASFNEVQTTICKCGLDERDGVVLLRWLHELGEVLHYADAPELQDLVMLDPQWVTRRVGQVLASAEVQNARGILTRACLERIWPDVENHVRQHLLGMMERFDLAYRIPEDQEHRCLVVERLPQNPPDYEGRWQAASGQPGVRLRYRLKSFHPGIPTWFIARCHRFTLGLHWLRGVLFGDNRHNPRHHALVVAKESERTVDFYVRGPQPWTFMPLLTDGFEDTILKRYPGLSFDRIAPCPGSRKDGTPCDYEFNLTDLEALRWPEEANVELEHEIRCTRCRTKHDIDRLLLGLSRAPSRDAEQLDAIFKAVHVEGEKTRLHISREMEDARQFIQLAFVQEWNTAQEVAEQSCPTVFALYPVEGKTLTRKCKLRLQFYCMNPHCWHSIGEPGMCEFQPRRDGLVTAARWLRTSLRWLRPAAALLPSGSQLAGEYTKDLHDFATAASNELKFTADLMKELKEFPEFEGDESSKLEKASRPSDQGDKMELYELKAFLDELDFSVKPYGGLRRVRTPEGHILWLCAEHAANFVHSF